MMQRENMRGRLQLIVDISSGRRGSMRVYVFEGQLGSRKILHREYKNNDK